MLGHNKYVVPFQNETQTLPFNVAGIDTIKYNQSNFLKLASHAIDQAIKETSQTEPAPSADQLISFFVLTKKAIFVDVANNPQEHAVFQLGNTFGFKYLVKFDGLSYVFLGLFASIQVTPIIWRLGQLLELLTERINAIPTRKAAGLADEKSLSAIDLFMQRLEIWIIVNSDKERDEISRWSSPKHLPIPLQIFTMTTVSAALSELPQ
jgi:hypothetical protein